MESFRAVLNRALASTNSTSQKILSSHVGKPFFEVLDDVFGGSPFTPYSMQEMIRYDYPG
jgi:hypothetical protein